MEQLDLRVTGMTCDACERRIERALARVQGVTQSVADHRGARVRVVFDPALTSAAAVQSCIERAGYTIAP